MLNSPIERSWDLVIERQDVPTPVRLAFTSAQVPKLARAAVDWFAAVPARTVPDVPCAVAVIQELRRIAEAGLGQWEKVFAVVRHCEIHQSQMALATLLGATNSWDSFWIAETWTALDKLAKLFGILEATLFDDKHDQRTIQNHLITTLIDTATSKAVIDSAMADVRFCLEDRSAPFPGADALAEFIETWPKNTERTASLFHDLRYRLTSA